MEVNLNPLSAEDVLKNTSKLEIPVPHEFKLNQTQRRIRGHIVFAWNLKDNSVVPATMHAQTIEPSVSKDASKTVIRHRINQNPEVIYLQALNKENAAKKILKLIAQLTLKKAEI